MFNVEKFLDLFKETTESLYGKETCYLTENEAFQVLCLIIKEYAISVYSKKSKERVERNEKEIYYFSMEFLVGRFLKENLIILNIYDIVKDGLDKLGFDIESICDEEQEPGLGNGGLGRLAACFLDSMASLDINGMGMGLRYKFGLFKQKIVNGEQIELPDDWLSKVYPWETKREDKIITVKFGGIVDRIYKDGKISYVHKDYREVLAVPYDVPILGINGESCNKLRIWNAVPKEEKFDLDAFNRGDYSTAVKHRNEIEAITYILYPDDSNEVGKRLRLEQEYLLVSAGISDIVSRYKNVYGKENLKDFHKHIAIHINDTHPTMCIPELIRILIDDEGLSWDDAYNVCINTIAYTNHTVLPEALEKWDIELMKKIVPRVYMIIEELNRRFFEKLDKEAGYQVKRTRNNSILYDGQVQMANLSVICSHSVNGVATIHSEIIKKETLNELYKLMPEKFSNKTNGISHRRFLMSANILLYKFLINKIGKDFIKDPDKLKDLLKYENDAETIKELENIKFENKVRLAKYIKEKNNIDVNPNSIFDIQVKRVHGYKRQLLFAFKILCYYNLLKEGKLKDFYPHTFIIAGKAAGSYLFAKKVIKLINNIANIVNNDNAVNEYLKVVFIENFCVSNAEIIYPASDISEQISLAGKEASGTGNMKFMFNGSVTLGTLDGANIDIKNQVGDDNIKIFGMDVNTVYELKSKGYNPNDYANNDERLKQIREQLIDGSLVIDKVEFWDIYDHLFKFGDEYMVTVDFDKYITASLELANLYKNNKYEFFKKSLINIANAGFFSSDRTIKEYYNDIWKK